MIVDLFAGPGGWDVGGGDLGLRPVGLELDAAACQTRAAAGHLTIRADVAHYPPSPFAGAEGLIASPPCTDFSTAGRRAGIDGESGALIFTVPAWVDAIRPRWIACEQVPPVLPYWRAFGRSWEALGYRWWAGILNSADYGVPQTRRRAILMAHRDRQPMPADPTHSRYPGGFDGLRPWVSMADALGWDRNLVLHTRRGQGPDGSTQTITLDRPAPTATGAPGQWALRAGPQKNATTRTLDEPAPTILAAFDNGGCKWVCGRPATTVMGDASGRVVRVSLTELAIIQGFDAGYPFQGNRSKRAEQIGNAVPPPLARAVLASLIGAV
ncbi:MAG: DNA cytosine methyltransferase [Clostridia bacterium]